MAIDIIDEKLLEVLQENARFSISELSKRINLSLSAVSDRLKKLEAGGIIKQYTTILDPAKMNKSVCAILLVGVESVANTELVKLAAAEPTVISADRIAGEYDYVLKVYTKDGEELLAVIDKIKNLKSVRRVSSSVVLGSVKEKYSVSPSAEK